MRSALDAHRKALEMPLYKGMRLHLTRNINKEAS